MRVFFGITNPSGAKRFEGFLDGADAGFLTLRNLGVAAEPEETGPTPEEKRLRVVELLVGTPGV